VSAACYAGGVRETLVGRTPWSARVPLDPRSANEDGDQGVAGGPGGSPHLASLVFFTLFTAGCGYISVPAPPFANIPNRPSDFAAVQRGSNIIVHFTVPTYTTENHALTKGVKLDVRIGPLGQHFVLGDWANEAKPAPPGTVEEGIATFKIPTQDWTGQNVAIGARAIGANGKHSEWSTVETLTVVPAPETPSRPDVTDTALGEHITWTGSGEQFRVLKQLGGDKDFVIANTLTGHEWTDTTVDYGKPVTYEVQALVPAGTKTAESDISAPYTSTPIDAFPPQVPAGLHADRSNTGVSLVWEPDSDADIAGYRVYRSEGNGPWQKIADVSTVPTYTDTAVEHGKTYHYAVSAIDKATPKINESERSEPVEILFP
jgi:hypothetical protein